MVTLVGLAVIVLAMTVVLGIRAKGRKAPLGPVIVLYGVAMAGILLVVGVYGRLNNQRTFDQCVISVKGREGIRDHFDFLYNTLSNSISSEQGQAFISMMQADLNENLPARTLADCGPNPDL